MLKQFNYDLDTSKWEDVPVTTRGGTDAYVVFPYYREGAEAPIMLEVVAFYHLFDDEGRAEELETIRVISMPEGAADIDPEEEGEEILDGANETEFEIDDDEPDYDSMAEEARWQDDWA